MKSLQDLVGQFCTILGSTTPVLAANAEGIFAFSVTVRGVDINVSHDQLRGAGHAVICVYFGDVPAAQEAAILRNLLHANFTMRELHAPAFCCDPHSEQIALKYVYPLAEASGESLWAGLQVLVEKVLRWRTEPFHDGMLRGQCDA